MSTSPGVQQHHARRHDARVLRDLPGHHLPGPADLVGDSRACSTASWWSSRPSGTGEHRRMRTALHGAQPVTGPTGPIPVIMDVDTGIDDAFALMFAVRHPGHRSAGGHLCGRQLRRSTRWWPTPVTCWTPPAPGRSRSVAAQRRRCWSPVPDTGHFHGADGLGGFSRPSDRRTSPLSAVELLRHELLAAVGQWRADHPGGDRPADQHRAAAARPTPRWPPASNGSSSWAVRRPPATSPRSPNSTSSTTRRRRRSPWPPPGTWTSR